MFPVLTNAMNPIKMDISCDMPDRFRQWVVAQPLANEALAASHFEQRMVPMPALHDGEALVRVKLLNVHAATRLRIARGQVAVGQTDPENYACAQVVASRDPIFGAGDLVACQAGWQEYQVIRSADEPVGFSRPHDGVVFLNRTQSPWTYVFRPELARLWSPSLLMEIFGTSGMTAWFGLQQCGPLTPDDAVAVAAATGSVGSIIAQLAKAAGCRVVGFAGGIDRCSWVREELGVDACLDYTTQDFDKDLRMAFPDGIDVFSDGVGGPMTDIVVRHMNRRGRLFSYGSAAASYAGNTVAESSQHQTLREKFGISASVEQLIRDKSLRSDAWTVDRFYHERLAAEDGLSRLMSMGKLRSHARTVTGFERLPDAIADQYRTRGIGKLQISFE
jgi:NADPH-dependent curcumin reductase CurA